MKRVLIIISGLLILAGGLISIMKFMDLGPFEPVVVEKVIEKEVETAPVPIFIEMEAMTVPVFKGNTVVATVQISITLEVIGKNNASRVNKLMIRVKDIFLRDLHSFLPRLIKQEERIDVLILKQRLKLMADKYIGRSLIENVLVQSVIETPIK